MAKRFNLQKPLIMFHGNSSVYGKPNSLAAIKAAIKYASDIIELDVRKSRDDILYCYHGGFLAVLLKYFRFQTIKKLVGVDSLEEILSIIPKDKIIFLDIKEQNINSGDLEKICAKYPNEFWLAAYSLSYLNKLRKNLGNNYQYVCNFSFLFLNFGMKRMKRNYINIFKIFWWQCSDENINKIKKYELAYTIQEKFCSQKRHDELARKYGSLWIARNNLTK
jgi:hypothetical protein